MVVIFFAGLTYPYSTEQTYTTDLANVPIRLTVNALHASLSPVRIFSSPFSMYAIFFVSFFYCVLIA